MAKKSNLEVIARFKNSMVHFYREGELICSTKSRICRITNLEVPELEVVGEIPWKLSQHVSNSRIVDRYLRNSILQVRLDETSPDLFRCEQIQPRPIPVYNEAFETAWRKYRAGEIY